MSAALDEAKYPRGVKVERHELQTLHLERAAFHGEWNYCLGPHTEAQLTASREAASKEVNPVSHAERNEKWMKLIREQLLSGLRNRRFCRERGINRNTFTGARRRLVGQIRNSPRAAKKFATVAQPSSFETRASVCWRRSCLDPGNRDGVSKRSKSASYDVAFEETTTALWRSAISTGLQ